MSWTNPRTWVAGELVTAALLNTHLRDNLSALKASYGTSFPASPIDGQEHILVDSLDAAHLPVAVPLQRRFGLLVQVGVLRRAAAAVAVQLPGVGHLQRLHGADNPRCRGHDPAYRQLLPHVGAEGESAADAALMSLGYSRTAAS